MKNIVLVLFLGLSACTDSGDSKQTDFHKVDLLSNNTRLHYYLMGGDNNVANRKQIYTRSDSRF